MTNFVHLHVHSAFSIKDGVGKVQDYIDKVKADGQTALALTEHGNMYSHLDFYFKAKKSGIKPILGIEAYFVFDRHTRKDEKMRKRAYHMTLLCENNEGLQNLREMLTEANETGYYYNARIDLELLRKHSKGLICLSGCLGGWVQQEILNDDIDGAEEAIETLVEIFGKERFFLEVMRHGQEEQEKILSISPKLAKKYGIGVVASNDAHYCNKEDKLVQNALIAMRDHTTLDDPELKAYKTDEFYIKTKQEMLEVFPDNTEWLENSQKIADMCNVELVYDKIPFPTTENAEEKIRDLCREGWKTIIAPFINKDQHKEYGERIKYELDVINQNGFANYFLIVQDIVQFARSRKIPMNPGRGSVGGSLVAFVLGITEIDPIKYGLYFERFLNPSRISPPDIDLDFADTRRDEVIQYTRDKYGKDNFAKTLTFGNFKPRFALRMAFKVYGHDMETQDTIAKMVPTKVVGGSPNVKFSDLYTGDYPELEVQKEKHPKEFALAEKLEGNPNHVSTHASAYVLTDTAITNYVPLDYDPRNEDMRIGVDMYSSDYAKLLKMDFLGVETLSIVENAINTIKDRHDIEIELSALPLDDEKTWTMIARGDTIGIFQFESDGMRELLRKAMPTNELDLADCNGLYRPGAMDFIDDYCATKLGAREATPIHPLMEPVLRETYGVCVYQEQVMKMCQLLAGFTLPEADYMRKAIGKKKEEDMAKLKPMFSKGCHKNGIDKEIVEEILEWFSNMSRYNFNKSHALGYAKTAYRSAYVKANYPIEFATAALNKKTKELSDYLTRFHDAKKRGIVVNGPSINHSGYNCTIVDNEIYFGLNLIKGTTSPNVKKILEEKENNGPFKDYEDFFKRCYKFVDKRTMEAFVNAGVFDCVGLNRKWAIGAIEEHIKFFGKAKRRDARQVDMFSDIEVMSIPDTSDLFKTHGSIKDFTETERLAREKIVLGFYASGSPLDPYKEILYSDEFVTSAQLASMEDDFVVLGGIIKTVRRIKDKNDNLMAFAEVEDDIGVARCIVFSKKYNTNKSLLREGTPVIVKGTVNKGSILIKSIRKLEA